MRFRLAMLAVATIICFVIAIRMHAADAGAAADILGSDAGWKTVVEGTEFPDGLSCDAAGNLHFSDLIGKNTGVFRFSTDGAKNKLFDGGRSGTKMGPDGKLYGCGGGKLTRFDLATGEKTTLAEGLSTNDLAVSPAGHIYLTETAKKQVTWFDPTRNAVKAADVGIAAPNGIAVDPEGKTLYVSDSGGPKVFAFKIMSNGSLAEKKALMTLRSPNEQVVASGDGMAVDATGRVYVTSQLGIQIFDSAGQWLGVIGSPCDGSLRSVAFAGRNFDVLYAACGSRIYSRPTRVKGPPPFGELLKR